MLFITRFLVRYVKIFGKRLLRQPMAAPPPAPTAAPMTQQQRRRLLLR